MCIYLMKSEFIKPPERPYCYKLHRAFFVTQLFFAAHSHVAAKPFTQSQALRTALRKVCSKGFVEASHMPLRVVHIIFYNILNIISYHMCIYIIIYIYIYIRIYLFSHLCVYTSIICVYIYIYICICICIM